MLLHVSDKVGCKAVTIQPADYTVTVNQTGLADNTTTTENPENNDDKWKNVAISGWFIAILLIVLVVVVIIVGVYRVKKGLPLLPCGNAQVHAEGDDLDRSSHYTDEMDSTQ